MTNMFFKPIFFKYEPVSRLPTPAEVRNISNTSGNIRSKSFIHPLPVKIPTLGLVKYGVGSQMADVQTTNRKKIT